MATEPPPPPEVEQLAARLEAAMQRAVCWDPLGLAEERANRPAAVQQTDEGWEDLTVVEIRGVLVAVTGWVP